MVCTDDAELHAVLRMLRSHGMAREAGSAAARQRWTDAHPDLSPDFIFALPGFNVRTTEINAVIGRSQLRRLDANNELRRRNLRSLPEASRPRALPDRFRDAGLLQLRLHAGAARARRTPARSRDGDAARERRRVPPRHLGRRQPAPPAVPARDRGSGRDPALSARGSRALLRVLHRQLPRSRARSDRVALRYPECPFERDGTDETRRRSGAGQPGRPRPDLPVAGERAGRDRASRVGRADRELRAHAGALGRDRGRKRRGPLARGGRRARDRDAAAPRRGSSSTVTSPPPRRR